MTRRVMENPQSYANIENYILNRLLEVISQYHNPRWTDKPISMWNHIRDIMTVVVEIHNFAFSPRDRIIFDRRYPQCADFISTMNTSRHVKPSNRIERVEAELASKRPTTTFFEGMEKEFKVPQQIPEGFTTPPSSEWFPHNKVRIRSDLDPSEKYNGVEAKEVAQFAGDIFELIDKRGNAWHGYTDLETYSLLITPEMTTAPDVQHLIRKPSQAPPPPPPSIFITPEGERVEVPRAPSRFEFLEPLYQQNPYFEGVPFGNVPRQYQSLNDKYPRGNIEIWYWRNPEDNVSGKLWCMEVMKGNFPTAQDIRNDYSKVGSIEATNEEDIYIKMQGEVWSPHGEARELINRLGLSHTSMSVGDVIIINPSREAFVVDLYGFTAIGVI